MLAKEDVIFHEAATTIQQITAEEIHKENLRAREKYYLSMRTHEVIDAKKDAMIAEQTMEISQLKEQLSKQIEENAQLKAQFSQLAAVVAELKAEKTKPS